MAAAEAATNQPEIFLKTHEEDWSFINLDVTGDTLVTEEGRDPCFTPDGTRLLWEYNDIYISTLDGKQKHILIKNGEEPCV